MNNYNTNIIENMDINSNNNIDINNNIISDNNYQNYESNNRILYPITIPTTFSESTSKKIYNNNTNSNNFIDSNSNNLANIKTFDTTYNENNNININHYTKYQETQISNALELMTISSEPFQTMSNSKSENLDYNINNNSNLDISLEKLQKKYRVETEIVPVKMTENVFFKKIKYVKNK